MCEVLRSNFEDLFPKIETAIISAEFLGVYSRILVLVLV